MSGPGARFFAAIVAPSVVALCLAVACGCQKSGYTRSAADAEMFGAQAVRIHPTFTRTKDWTGDGKPDGVEAVLELQDEFGEPTRATGRAMFEIYQYRPYHPDPRGRRVEAVWDWPLTTRQQQVEHWSRALRAYSFKIPYDPGNHTVVLAATFDLNGDKPRLFDQIILEPSGRTAPPPGAEEEGPQTRPGRERGRQRPTTQPTTAPIEMPTDAPGEDAPGADAPDDDATAGDAAKEPPGAEPPGAETPTPAVPPGDAPNGAPPDGARPAAPERP